MKKILLMTCGLACYSSIFAAQPSIVCPATLACDYNAGTCELPAGQWFIGNTSGFHSWTGTKIFPLSQISGNSYIDIDKQYQKITQLACVYQVGPDPDVTGGFSLSIVTTIKSFEGTGWSFSGWGGNNATCNSITDPNTCAAS